VCATHGRYVGGAVNPCGEGQVDGGVAKAAGQRCMKAVSRMPKGSFDRDYQDYCLPRADGHSADLSDAG